SHATARATHRTDQVRKRRRRHASARLFPLGGLSTVASRGRRAGFSRLGAAGFHGDVGTLRSKSVRDTMAEHLRKRGKIWYATVYDSSGERRECSTGCTDKAAARTVLAKWEREAAAPDNGTTTLNTALTILIEDREARARNGQGAKRTV